MASTERTNTGTFTMVHSNLNAAGRVSGPSHKAKQMLLLPKPSFGIRLRVATDIHIATTGTDGLRVVGLSTPEHDGRQRDIEVAQTQKKTLYREPKLLVDTRKSVSTFRRTPFDNAGICIFRLTISPERVL